MSDQTSDAMRVDTDLVRQLAQMLTDNDLTEIEVEDGGRRISVKRKLGGGGAPMTYAASPPPPPAAAAAPAAPVSAEDHPGTVPSPMVGTVYLSADPASRPFVAVGDSVAEGDTLLIIEAMKVMNQIVAPRAGTVRQILVQNAEPVEFGQPLAIIE